MTLLLLYLIAITVVMHDYYESLSKVSRSSQLELEGIALIKPISKTVQLIQQHRGLSAGLLGGIEDLRSARAAKLIEATAAFNALKSQLPARLILSQDWIRIEADWNKLQADGISWAIDANFTAHTHLIGQLQNFEIDIADEYDLTVDPNLSSFYLLDTAIWKLPGALERLGQIRAYGTGILAKKSLSEYQKTMLISLVAQLDDTLKTLIINLDKTGRLNPKIQVQLSETGNYITDSSHMLAELVRSDIINSGFSTLPKDFIKITTDVINKNYLQLYGVLLPATEMLINERIERSNKELRLSIGAAMLLLLVALYFLLGSYFAIKDSIWSLARSARVIAKGNLEERINLDTRDELGQVGDSFNEMADGFQVLLASHLETEERLSAITDNAPTVIFMKDVSGRYIHVNRLYEELFHVDNADLQGKTDHDIFPREMADAFCKNDQKVIQSGQPIEIEELVPHDDGIHTYISLKFPLRRTSGEIYAVCGIATDITKRRQAEREQEKSNLLFSTILDATPDAMLMTDEQGVITLANRQAGALFGYQAGELVGLSIDVLIPDRYHAKHNGLRLNYIAAPVVRPMSAGMGVSALRKDGSEFNAEISLSPIQTEQGLLTVCALRDVTQRKLMEDALRASEARFRRMADASPAMIWITDADGNPTFVNKTWLDFTGIGLVDALTHEGWIKIIHPDDLENVFVAYYKNTYAQKPILTEYRLRRADGDWRWILDKGMPIYNESGGFNGYIGSAIDITDRKQAEIELRLAAVAFESQESMMITDANSVILRVNKAFTETTGYEANELIGQTPNLLKSGRHNAEFYAEMWETLLRTGSWQGEIYDRRKNGEIYPKYLTISAVKADDGNISHYVGTHLDITVSKAAAAKIERLAFYDPLTGLPNRRLLQDRLKPALASSNRSGRKGALLFIDMDNFKTLNDTLGHDMGDLLLEQVAERLTACVREGDTVARLGGDEFVVMLENLSEQAGEAAVQTETIGEKILSILNQPYRLASHDYRSTPSIGAVLFNDHERSIEELLKQADIAMYQAKASGRNALRFFDPQMQISIAARAAMQADLHLALAENQFILHFQPQVYHNYQIVGAEVLIRWQHPQRGLIPPAEFIPLAEEAGLILLMGQWVLEQACAQIKKWEGSEHTQHLLLAVNVSARQFRQTDFVEQVSHILHHSAINPDKLKLELTESLVLDNIDDTIIKMNALREMGVRFSMDDFGTGYSSLSSLKKLPLSQLKIDQSFVCDLSIDPDDAVIVQTIIAMANNLSMGVIAEGVETEAQRAFLELHNCPLFQGYLFSKPVPIEQFEQLLKRS